MFFIKGSLNFIMKIKRKSNFIIGLFSIVSLGFFLNSSQNTETVRADNLKTEVHIKEDAIEIEEDKYPNFSTKCHKESTEPELPVVSVEEYYQNMSATHKITPNQLVNMVQANKTIALMIGFPECKYCRAFSRTLKEFTTKTSVPLYYLNIDDLLTTDLTPEFLHIVNDIVKLQGTPTVSLIKRGKLIHQYVGADTSLQKLMTLTKYKY